MKLSLLAVLLSLVSSAVARPHEDREFKTHESNPKSLYKKCCEVKKSDTGDDTDNILNAFEECKHYGIVTFKKGVTYNIVRPINYFDFDTVEIKLDGNIYVPYNVSYYLYEGQVYNTSSKFSCEYYLVMVLDPLARSGGNAYPTNHWPRTRHLESLPIRPTTITRFLFFGWSSLGGKIDGVTFENSPFWTLNLVNATNIIVNDVNITAKSSNEASVSFVLASILIIYISN
ncbi:LOW QUALITY PROTEIN: pectin lyase fold/virulence factor [Jimgerdemannia flammicorona]|uniref:Pectin lyase fold/virulence factor n=1 Tax=Jimgerdemannia flammicorona TaxID=994334 RepID=A0A433QHP5_9FUNG|nr:LOW QUALITY PROTEIN: pectin lyase fold/virulence factor [Jimgerdemannia flammicorona]